MLRPHSLNFAYNWCSLSRCNPKPRCLSCSSPKREYIRISSIQTMTSVPCHRLSPDTDVIPQRLGSTCHPIISSHPHELQYGGDPAHPLLSLRWICSSHEHRWVLFPEPLIQGLPMRTMVSYHRCSRFSIAWVAWLHLLLQSPYLLILVGNPSLHNRKYDLTSLG